MSGDQADELIATQAITIYADNHGLHQTILRLCTRATRVLEEVGYEFEEIAADGNPALRAELLQRSASTLPQIFVGDESVGGYRELTIMLSNGRFKQLLERD